MVSFDKIYTPNAFSPNAPAEIDRVFQVYCEGVKTEAYHLMILSRWNDIIFESKNEIIPWDGKMGNGNNAPAGNYLWVLKYVDYLGEAHRQTGTVALLY